MIPLAALFGKVVAGWNAIPPKVKLWGGVFLLALAAFFVHQHIVKKALADAKYAGYTQARNEDLQEIVMLRAQVSAVQVQMNSMAESLRSANDAANATTSRTAADLSLRGPGASSCRRISDPKPAAITSRSQPANQPAADAARPVLPADDGLAGVPWNWLVGRGKQCDLDSTEALAWRSWYQQLVQYFNNLKEGAEREHTGKESRASGK